MLDRVFELAGQVGDLNAATLTDRGLTAARAEAVLVVHQHGRPMVQRQFSQAPRCTRWHVAIQRRTVAEAILGWIANAVLAGFVAVADHVLHHLGNRTRTSGGAVTASSS